MARSACGVKRSKISAMRKRVRTACSVLRVSEAGGARARASRARRVPLTRCLARSSSATSHAATTTSESDMATREGWGNGGQASRRAGTRAGRRVAAHAPSYTHSPPRAALALLPLMASSAASLRRVLAALASPACHADSEIALVVAHVDARIRKSVASRSELLDCGLEPTVEVRITSRCPRPRRSFRLGISCFDTVMMKSEMHCA